VEKLRDRLSEANSDVENWRAGNVEQEDLTECQYQAQGCPFSIPSLRIHQLFHCGFRPTRCPSLTCTFRPAAANLAEHIAREHDGATRGRDVVVRTGGNSLTSSYVNLDREPLFYKNTKMSWVANELVCDGERFYMECVREPPEWFLWVWGSEETVSDYKARIRIFSVRHQDTTGVQERSWSGAVIPLSVSREEIVRKGLGFMVHDKQVQPLCGPIEESEEQLFGYQVTVERA